MMLLGKVSTARRKGKTVCATFETMASTNSKKVTSQTAERSWSEKEYVY